MASNTVLFEVVLNERGSLFKIYSTEGNTRNDQTRISLDWMREIATAVHRFREIPLDHIDPKGTDEVIEAWFDCYKEEVRFDSFFKGNRVKLSIYSIPNLEYQLENHPSIIQFFVEEFPMAQNWVYKTDDRLSPHAFIELLKEYRFNQKDTFGKYALHNACANTKLPLNCLETLVNDYPNALNDQTGFWGCLLHIACKNHRSLEVIQFVYNLYPEGIQEVDNCGCLPLHVACESNQSIDVIEFLVNRYPNSIQQLSSDGWYPLHIASAYGQTEEVIFFLVDLFPEALAFETNDGYTPLELIIEAKASDEASEENLQSNSMSCCWCLTNCFSPIEFKARVKGLALYLHSNQ